MKNAKNYQNINFFLSFHNFFLKWIINTCLKASISGSHFLILGFHKYIASSVLERFACCMRHTKPLHELTISDMFKSKAEGTEYSKTHSNMQSQQRTLQTFGILEELYRIQVCMRQAWSWSLLLLRWVEMKLGVVIEESQVLQTHLNLRSDLTGSLDKMFSTMSSGRWFFHSRRIRDCGRESLVWSMFSPEQRFQFLA